MDRNLVCTCVLLSCLMAAGCEENDRRQAGVAEPAPALPTFTTVTLSADQLMTLDWGGRSAGRSTIVDKRLAGAGVEFDIRFPGNEVGICSIDYTSSGAAGQGTLAGLDVSAYKALALKFTVVSVNGQVDPNHPLELAVGAVIGPAGDGKLSACEPVVLGFAPERATQVATTPMRTERIRIIGIHAHVANPKVWDINGGVVTLRVEPAAEADILPSPIPAEREPRRAARTTARRRPAESTAASGSPSHPENVRSAKPGSRTNSSSLSRFGTQRTGAW